MVLAEAAEAAEAVACFGCVLVVRMAWQAPLSGWHLRSSAVRGE